MRQTVIVLAGLAAASLTLVGCDVQKTQEGNVNLPKYEVSKTQEGNVTVPKYEVEKKETVTLPKVEVTPAQDRDDDKHAQKK